MPAHLRVLPMCRTCGAPASQELVNAVNAPSGVYCKRHATAALKLFAERHPE